MRSPRRALLTLAAPLTLAATILATPRDAHAFCGFYVGGADAKLFNNATQVALMREGQRTVLSMQNNYQGPPANFAMVVPVPVVLQKENVKTLPKDIFARLDQLAAPRLVEYWEQDPCWIDRRVPMGLAAAGATLARPAAKAPHDPNLGVRVEARFTVGEYEIVILSAEDAGGLDTWLRRSGYKIPDGAAPYLRPYVEAGSKFFVAKVDVTRVAFERGMATLSPLRFHYDSERFSLPVRLGLMNANGPQDLIVHVLSRRARYEVTNYPNVAIPTNLEVKDATRQNFGAFYVSLFDRTLERFPGAVVTEYAWDAGSCDPCPTPPLTAADVTTLGADVAGGAAADRGGFGGGFILTRLHARYTKDTLGADLVFREAEPIAGGREHIRSGVALEEGAVREGANNFQGRYVIRHAWTGHIACANPVRGRWGGPLKGTAADERPRSALGLAFQPRSTDLAGFVSRPVPDSAFSFLSSPSLVPPLAPTSAPGAATSASAAAASTPPPPATDGGLTLAVTSEPNAGPVRVPPPAEPSSRGCGCREAPAGPSLLGFGAIAACVVALSRRRAS